MTTDNTYYWESTGGCARCDAMEGYHYGEEPTRPHMLCQCTVTLEQEGSDECYQLLYIPDNGRRGADWSKHPTKGGVVGPNETFGIIYEFELHCLNSNDRHQIEIWSPQNTSDHFIFDSNGSFVDFHDELFDDWIEVEAEAKERASELCNCGGLVNIT